MESCVEKSNPNVREIEFKLTTVLKILIPFEPYCITQVNMPAFTLNAELLFCCIFLFGSLICSLAWAYDSTYKTSLYPSTIYGGDDNHAHEIETYRARLGAFGLGSFALACYIVFTCFGQSSVSRCLSFIAIRSDPRSSPPSMFPKEKI